MKTYLYGVVPSETAEDWDHETEAKIGNHSAPIEAITHQGIGFLYSQVDIGSKLRATRKNVKTHSETLGDLLEETETLAPVSFGAILDDMEAVKSLISENRASLLDTLEKISGKVEYGVKAYWDPDEVAEVIGNNDQEVQKLKERVQSGKVQDQYQATVEVGELIDEKIEERKDQLKESMLEHLTPVSEEWVENDLFDERMAANFAFLLERSSQEEFDEAMQALGKAQDSYLTFKYNGPWPPFNFVDMELR